MRHRPLYSTNPQDELACAKPAEREKEVINRRQLKGHTQRQWEMRFFQCGCECIYCGEPLTLGRATKDHLTPISRNGSDDISNIAPACFPCNVKKGRKTYEEFIASRRVFSTRPQNRTALITHSTEARHAPPTPLAPRLTDIELLGQLQAESHNLKAITAERENVGWWSKTANGRQS